MHRHRIQLWVVKTQLTCITCFTEAMSPPKIYPLYCLLVIVFQGCCFWEVFNETSSDWDSVSCTSLSYGICTSLSILVSPTQVFPARYQVTGEQNLCFFLSCLLIHKAVSLLWDKVALRPSTSHLGMWDPPRVTSQDTIVCPKLTFYNVDLIREDQCDLGSLTTSRGRDALSWDICFRKLVSCQPGLAEHAIHPFVCSACLLSRWWGGGGQNPPLFLSCIWAHVLLLYFFKRCLASLSPGPWKE